MEKYYDDSIDEKFLLLDDIKYLPWIGSNYFSEKNNRKILLILESVYNWGEDDQTKKEAEEMLGKNDFVRKLIKEQGLFFTCGEEGRPKSLMARGIEKSILGKKDSSNSEKEKLWTDIAFHELVQRPLNKNERPGKEDYQKGADLLKKIVDLIDPKLCIFYGTDYRKLESIKNSFNVSDNDITCEQKINRAIPRILKIESKKGGKFKIIMVKHPSSFFSWDKWNSFIIKHM